MSYVANQYNYSTPLQSSNSLTDATSLVKDRTYFTLFDNSLDGTYYPISGDVGLWGTSVADATGVLPEPFVVTVTETLTLNALSISGSTRCFPVDFTIELYNGNTLLYTYTKHGNDVASITCTFDDNYSITRYVVAVTRISNAGVARLYNSYQSWYVALSDTLKIHHSHSRDVSVKALVKDSVPIKASNDIALRNNATASDAIKLSCRNASRINNRIDKLRDTLRLTDSAKTSIVNTIDKTYDSLRAVLKEDISHVINTIPSSDILYTGCSGAMSMNSSIVNIHSAMKATTRRVFGKVYITYTDPLLDSTTTSVLVNDVAYNSDTSQINDGTTDYDGRLFTLYENDLSGRYLAGSKSSQVGWSSVALSDSDGYFAEAQLVELKFYARPIVNFTVVFDSARGNFAKDFTVEITQVSGTKFVKEYVDNEDSEVSVPLPSTLADVVSIKISITRISKPHYPATIIDATTISKILYTGYQDDSNLVSIDLLEELTYQDEVEALGGMSANEVTVSLDNTDKHFAFNNPNSPIANQLKRNRKIEPYLGAEVLPGTVEWYPLGTYWSYSWDVPLDSLVAKVTAFDNIGLLDITSFINHHVLVDKSIGYLIEYVLSDAKSTLGFIKWNISEELYNVTVPYAWFDYGSHAAALRKICAAYPMHIYCDRAGIINAAPQRLHATEYHDVWSNDTNVVDKNYSSLYATLPNLVNISVVSPTFKYDEELVSDTLVFNVTTTPTRRLNFRSPFVSDLVLEVQCDSGVEYDYTVYSWGIDVSFTGSGAVQAIKCYGTALDTSNTATLSRRDEDSILRNGVVTRDISADFIQTAATATYIMDRLFELSTYDKYDVEVNYRGNIALSINDNILLVDGLLPSNMYTIKRHQLMWNGSLTGSADLNT